METSDAESAGTRSVPSRWPPEGGGLSAGGGERSPRGFSFLDGIVLTASAPQRTGEGGGGFRAEAEGGSRHTHTHARARAHTRLRRAGRDPEEGRGVVTPATAGARPSAPAISAGRSAGTRTPPPAAPSAAKAAPFPPPPPVSDAWARAGLEPAFPRGGGRRARAGTRICHLQSTNHQVARPAGGSP